MRTQRNSHSGFSLVEVVLAIGVAIVFLVGVFCLLSVGLNTSKQASDDTAVSLILQDVANRVRGNDFVVTPDPVNKPIGPFYYDNKGRYVEQNSTDETRNVSNASQILYRASATIGALDPSVLPSKANLLCVVMKLYAPVAPVVRAPIPPGMSPKIVFSYYVTRSTGNGWNQVDSTYVPKIER